MKTTTHQQKNKHTCYFGCHCQCHTDQDNMFSNCGGDCCTNYKDCPICQKNNTKKSITRKILKNQNV